MDEKVFELMTKMYSEFTEYRKETNEKFVDLKEQVNKTNLVIEHDIKPTLGALLDGYKQNAEKLGRIESEVTRHDEFIMKRIK